MRRRWLPLMLGPIVVGAITGAGVYRATRDDSAGVRTCATAERGVDVPKMDQGDDVTVHFEPVAANQLAVGMTQARDGRLLIVTKDGKLWQTEAGRTTSPVLDVTDEVDDGIEQGLLGVAVSPDGDHVYLYGTWRDGTAGIIELELTETGVDEGSRRTVLSLDDPHPSHNGGRLAFVEGELFLGLGDGGDGDKTGASQDEGSPFGKLLRIDTETGEWRAWASGLRNPWGWSFDRSTGALWVGDVGQFAFEEINVCEDGGRGANFGWPHLEGAHEFDGPVLGPEGQPAPELPVADVGPQPDDLVAPILEYAHAEGTACSVIGGFVYRGRAIPELEGAYLWADLCLQAIHTIRRAGGSWVSGEVRGMIPPGIVAFGEGLDGELYVLSMSDGVFKIVP